MRDGMKHQSTGPERQQKIRAKYALKTSSSSGYNSHVTPAESFMGMSALVISKLSFMQQ